MVLIWYPADTHRKRFFSGQMRAKLRSFRLGAGLTQDELARRMVYSTLNRRMPDLRLGAEVVSRSTLEVPARYLQGR